MDRVAAVSRACGATDPARYRVILLDQRGCGRSSPHAGDATADLTTNTTHHLVGDLERLREHLAVDRWVLFGGSWGCVLGLAYAQRFPDRVRAAVMMGIATGRRAETDLLTRGVRRIFPEAWERLAAHVPEVERDGDLAASYARLLASPDPAVHGAAADEWCRWEAAIEPRAPDFFDEAPADRLAQARIVTHYWAHGSWLDEGEIIANAARLAGIPGVLVQGTLDLGNLLGTPWQLASVWPDAELRLVDAGHEMRSEAMVDALVQALDSFGSAA